PQDTLGAPAVAIVSAAFVQKFLKDRDPLGALFKVDEGAGKPEPVYQIIGVAADTKYDDMRAEFGPIAYVAQQQAKKADTDVTVVLRSSLPFDALTTAIEHAVVKMNPSIGVEFRVLKTQIRETLLRERLMASLSGFFGLLAGILATVGLYGVISYMVVRRRNEIGIRMALGADRRRVLGLVIKEAAWLVAMGVGIGSVCAFAMARTAASLLYGLSARDPLTFVAAAV